MAKIQDKSIFGEYKQPENRVTAAFLHVLKIGKDRLICYLFKDKIINFPDSNIDIQTQIKNDSGVNDGTISCGFAFNIKIESKLTDEINVEQLNRYLDDLAPNSNLVYLVKTDKCQELKRVPYFTWTELDRMLEAYLNEFEVGEVEEYLIDQFRMMLENLGLVDKYKDRVIVVAGTFGAKIAAEYNIYACQNHRFFKKAKFIAFYSNKEIASMYEIDNNYPKNDVYLRDEGVSDQFFKEYGKWYRETDKLEVFKLKGENLLSDKVIKHETKNSNNRIGAYTQKQRYVSYPSIMKATTTDELEPWN